MREGVGKEGIGGGREWGKKRRGRERGKEGRREWEREEMNDGRRK